MFYKITHVTTYGGEQPVSVGYNEARLAPRACAGQVCRTHHLDIAPRPSFRTTGSDYFGNPFTSFSFSQGYTELKVTSTSEVTVSPRADVPANSPPWNEIVERLRTHATADDLRAFEFAFASPQAGDFEPLKLYAQESFEEGRPIIEALGELTNRVHKDFVYDPRATTVTTAVPEVFALRRGVCQDFAHLQIAALRSLGLAARYISGYLRTYPPEGKPRLIGADASHAWLSVYCGGELGWVDVDPTNDRFTSTDHVTVAWGRDYADVPPLKGVFIGGGQNTLAVSVDVAPIED